MADVAAKSAPEVTEEALENRQCAVCPQLFTPRSDTHAACSPRCAQRWVNAQKRAAAADRRATRERLVELRPRSDWLKLAQRTFNSWILIRDAGKPCVSCGRRHKGKVDAGHYIAAGEREALTFDPANLHLQCHPCNGPKHGNLVPFRAELLIRIGPDEVARLEDCRELKTHTVDELKAITAHYRGLIRAKMMPNGEAT